MLTFCFFCDPRGFPVPVSLRSQQARAKKLRFGRSPIHAWGVFADEPLLANEMLLEYRGELIGNALADKRADEYERKRVRACVWCARGMMHA